MVEDVDSIRDMIDFYGAKGREAYRYCRDPYEKEFCETGVAALEFFKAFSSVIEQEEEPFTKPSLSVDNLESPSSAVQWSYKGDEPFTWYIQWTAIFRAESINIENPPSVILTLERLVVRKEGFPDSRDTLGKASYWGREQSVMHWVKKEVALSVVSERLLRPFPKGT